MTAGGGNGHETGTKNDDGLLVADLRSILGTCAFPRCVGSLRRGCGSASADGNSAAARADRTVSRDAPTERATAARERPARRAIAHATGSWQLVDVRPGKLRRGIPLQRLGRLGLL